LKIEKRPAARLRSEQGLLAISESRWTALVIAKARGSSSPEEFNVSLGFEAEPCFFDACEHRSGTIEQCGGFEKGSSSGKRSRRIIEVLRRWH
jgi:hypothetical protein